VLTDSQRDDLADTYKIAPRAKFAVIAPGLDLEAYHTHPRHTGTFRAAHGIAPDAPLIAIVGRLVTVKNHALFLRAAQIVSRQMPHARFAIVGDGDLRDWLEAQVDALSLRDQVVFTGWQKDVSAVYADSDVLAITSVNEGTPFSVIEAIAAGCPVVATAVGGLPDLLEGGALGTLIAPDDESALAAALIAAITSPRDVSALRDHVLERYSAARLAADLARIYVPTN
jgi:glycosyltransferase involved in cell wall biosynthesis